MGFLDFVYESLRNVVYNGLTDFLTWIISLVNNLSFHFWENPIVQAFLTFSQWINGFVFVIAFVFALFDAAEEAGSFRQIDLTAMILNFIKGFAFTILYSHLAVGIMNISGLLTSYLKIDVSVTGVELGEQISNFASTGGFLVIVLALLGVIVAMFGFVIASIKRFGAMFVQVLTSAFYIPDVVRGETTKIGDWLRQTIAIAFTYTFQYILFYSGLTLLLTGSEQSDVLFCIAMWMGVPVVSKIMDKYGYSSGVGGGAAAASMASQGLSLLTHK